MARGRRGGRRRVRWLPVVIALLVLVDVASLRYALVVTPAASASFGVMNGAVLVQVRETVKGGPAPALGGLRRSAQQPKLIDFYRHGYSTAWWVRGGDEFWWWIKGRRPMPTSARVTASGVPTNAPPGTLISLGNGMFAVAGGAMPGPAVTRFRMEMPLWMPIALIGAPYLLARARRRVREPWRCRGCGYDLRGAKGGVCPECGGRGRAGDAGAPEPVGGPPVD